MTRGNVRERHGGKPYLDYMNGSFSRDSGTLQSSLVRRTDLIREEILGKKTGVSPNQSEDSNPE